MEQKETQLISFQEAHSKAKHFTQLSTINAHINQALELNLGTVKIKPSVTVTKPLSGSTVEALAEAGYHWWWEQIRRVIYTSKYKTVTTTGWVLIIPLSRVGQPGPKPDDIFNTASVYPFEGGIED